MIDILLRPRNEGENSTPEVYKSNCTLALIKMYLVGNESSICPPSHLNFCEDTTVCNVLQSSRKRPIYYVEDTLDRYIPHYVIIDPKQIVSIGHVKVVKKYPLIFLLNAYNICLYRSFSMFSEVEKRFLAKTKTRPYDFTRQRICNVIRLFGSGLVYYLREHYNQMDLADRLSAEIDTSIRNIDTANGFGPIIKILHHIIECPVTHGKLRFHGCFYEALISTQTCEQIYALIKEKEYPTLGIIFTEGNTGDIETYLGRELTFDTIRMVGVPNFYPLWSSLFLLADITTPNTLFIEFMTRHVQNMTGCIYCVKNYPPKIKRGVELCQQHDLDHSALPILVQSFCQENKKLDPEKLYPAKCYIYCALETVLKGGGGGGGMIECSIQIMSFLFILLLVLPLDYPTMQAKSHTMAVWIMRNIIRISKGQAIFPITELFNPEQVKSIITQFQKIFSEKGDNIFYNVECYVHKLQLLDWVLVVNDTKPPPPPESVFAFFEPRDKSVPEYLTSAHVAFFHEER